MKSIEKSSSQIINKKLSENTYNTSSSYLSPLTRQTIPVENTSNLIYNYTLKKYHIKSELNYKEKYNNFNKYSTLKNI